jgi:pimeloyl-ACP methyl ester carboxylesterase
MTFVRTDDFDCWYDDDYFGPPWLSPEVILIQHGCGRNSDYWGSWVPDLARDHRVIRRDMRAHGRSSAGADDHEWSPESLATDVVAFLDALGLDHVHYVGESLGGITGIVLGALHADRLATLTFVQTPLRTSMLNPLLRGEYPTWPDALRAEGPGNWTVRNMDPDDPHTEWHRQQWDANDRDALIRLTEAITENPVDVEHSLARITVPTLVLAPTESEMTSRQDQLLIQASIPESEIELFEGYAHNIYLQAPERCTSRILQFIADRTRDVAA